MGTNTADVSLPTNEKIVLKLSFFRLGLVTVSLPIMSLVVCLVSAVLFRYDRITETSCNVTHSIPSVSAIIGVSPQRYIWRVGIALHAAPRFAVGFMYLNLYKMKTPSEEPQRTLYSMLYKLVFVCYNVETACLILVSYISNVENYPIHEKVFVLFMIASVSYQLFTLVAFKWAFPHMHLRNNPVLDSYTKKRRCFVVLAVSTIILLTAFYFHRVHCMAGAFSFFSLAEYFIFLSVTLFHYSAVDDFNDSYWSAEFALADAKKDL